MLEQIAPWITPALLVGLFAWLRQDVHRLRRELRGTESELRQEIGGTEERLRREMGEMRREVNARIDDLDARMNARMDGFYGRLRALEASHAELKGMLMGKLTFIENYILRRNEPGEAPAE